MTTIRLTRQALRCPYCHADVQSGEDAVACCGCAAVLHRACWHEHGRCASCEGPLAQAHRVESLRARTTSSLAIRVTPTRCQAITRSGRQCSRGGQHGGYCWQHAEALVEIPHLAELELHEVALWSPLEEVQPRATPAPVQVRSRPAPRRQPSPIAPRVTSTDDGNTLLSWLGVAIAGCVVLALLV